MAQLSEHELIRREKLSKLIALGVNPYPAELFSVSHNSEQIKLIPPDAPTVGINKSGSMSMPQSLP